MHVPLKYDIPVKALVKEQMFLTEYCYKENRIVLKLYWN